MGSPLFDKVTVYRDTIEGNTCTLEIIAHNNSKVNVYVDKVLLRGKEFSGYPFLDHIDDLRC